ncbi:hypothetical protein EMILIAHAH_92 [Bacillus phage vB_BanH_Emiliahah]|nr:hypothetical protein EMILIAHAH_92 [Bacillus phage vB_BanH_Emiliahah]
MEQQQQPQGKQINPNYIFNEQQAYIFELTTENIKLKAYIAQLQEENDQLQEQLQEPPVEKPTE